MAQTYDPNVKIKDGNTVLYTCHFRDYPRKWVAADGSTTQKITFEKNKSFAVSIYSANCFEPINGNDQNVDVRVAVFGSSEEKATIPTDADKTNGYVTFTQASTDNASFKQFSVVVNGTSWKANFRLNVNVFNSQEGEIEDYVQTSDLSSYVKKSDMSGYAQFKILRDNA